MLMSRGLTSLKLPRFGRLRVVIARSLLRFKHVQLSHLAPADRWGAARAQALVWRPFEHSDVRLCLRGDEAVIFAWDSRRAAAALEVANLNADQVTLIPEPLMWAASTNDGVRVVVAAEGIEAQYWQAGFMRASRWWPEHPEAAEWQNFLHGAAVPVGLWPGDQMPAATALPSLPRPWLEPRAPESATQQGQRAERWFVGGIGLVLVAATAGQLRSAWAQYAERSQLDEARTALIEKSAPVSRDRDQALEAKARIDVLTRELTAVQPLELLQHLGEVLPKQGVTLKEFDLDGTQLRLILDLAPGVSRSTLVSNLQSSPWFSAVTELQSGLQNGWVGFSLTLSGTLPPGARAVPASAGMPRPGGGTGVGGGPPGASSGLPAGARP